MVQFGKNQKFLNFSSEYNGFCLEFQLTLFPKVEVGDFWWKLFDIAIFLRKYQRSNNYFLLNFAMQIHLNLSKTNVNINS